VSKLATGFVDLQVNGYAGLDFNSESYTRDDLLALCERLRHDGVDRILATIITAPQPKMIDRIHHVATLIDTEPEIAQVISGIHIEGPFISPIAGYVGAHPVNSVLPASISVAEPLLQAGSGHIKLLTLAPEQDDEARVTRWLTSQNIIVAAGHSNASIDCLNQSIDAGLCLYTHLGNGCPTALPRHDNIIQRVLSLSNKLSISFIADGHHIPRLNETRAGIHNTFGVDTPHARCTQGSSFLATLGFDP
jgi:N-acetylglucosamine-6-phosphate deacetylase